MYCYMLLENPGQCAAGCGRTVVGRLAGHYYRDPMCDSCFQEAAPEVVEAIRSLEIVSIRLLSSDDLGTCSQCGIPLTGRVAGHHRGDPHCLTCFRRHSRRLAGLLLLDEAAFEAARTGSTEDLLEVATAYCPASITSAGHRQLNLPVRTPVVETVEATADGSVLAESIACPGLKITIFRPHPRHLRRMTARRGCQGPEAATSSSRHGSSAILAVASKALP